MPAKSCCRSCPRCDDCPVLIAAAARARRRDEQVDAVHALVEDVFAGVGISRSRALPDCVATTLEALDAARRGTPVGATAAAA
jgi:hypothetical protein